MLRSDRGRASSFSQFGQDILISDILFPNFKGIFVDVGARDGIVLSNTYRLEAEGWTGVAIEPHPDLFDRLLANRTCVCLNVAISGIQGTAEFLKMNEEPLGQSGIVATHTHMSRLSDLDHEIIEVPTITLASVASALPRIDYLDIDVEGHELDILRSANLAAWRVSVVGVECPPIDTVKTMELDRIMMEQGYLPFLQLVADRFYSMEQPIAQFSTREDLYGKHRVLEQNSRRWLGA
jgi:FkbM family methyltransferase